MEREIIATPEAPEAVGAYSQATTGNGFVFCSGQIPIDPTSGELVDGPVADQTRRCLDNLAAVLRAAGSGLERVVKVNAYLADIADFAEFNDAYSAYFQSYPPARAAIGASGLPKGARVEIECIALQ
ncbi:MAG: RidA family protein [Actinobacteria bacterium]|nr:RidA family protein [Actinomycetota bacterium]